MTREAELFQIFGWLWRASLDAGVLVLLILALRALAGNRWPAAWKAALWVVLVLRMTLPLPSLHPIALLPTRVSEPTLSALPQLSPKAALSERRSAQAEAQPAATSEKLSRPILKVETVLEWCAWIWLAGAALLGGRILLGNLKLWRAVRLGRVLTAQPTLDLLERCKADLGVRTLLCIVITERVPSPALFGLIRPRLLLPPHVLEFLSEEELRDVLLHELAHLKRLDLLWAQISAILLALHWFNPLVWLAFRQMRYDRELACDEAAVKVLAPTEAARYGQTLIKLLETLSPPPVLPMLAGVTEEANHFKRRIHMIARFMQPTHRRALRWSVACSLALVGVTLAAFTFRLQSDSLPPLLPKPLVDRIDFPFVNDPQLLGGWRSVDFVKDPDAFRPETRAWKGDLFFKELIVSPEGKTNWAFTWTKGHILHGGERTDSRYEIRTLSGRTFLFFQWKSGDYTLRGMQPSYYVLERDERLKAVTSRTEDRIDYPFVDDPEIHGVWQSVDFVATPEEFHPGARQWQGDLFLKQLDFQPGGQMPSLASTWTEGLVLSAANKTASHYICKQSGGKSYLFFEWKSGDYTLRGMKPSYYVLTR